MARMRRTSGLVLCVVLSGLGFAGLGGGRQAQGAALPEGKGKAEFVHNCTACHLASMVTRVKKTPEEWRKSVDEMAARGTDGTKEDLDNVVLYLVTNYGTDTPAKPAEAPKPQAAMPPLGASGAAKQSAALGSAADERVRRMIVESKQNLVQNLVAERLLAGPSRSERDWNGL